MFLNLFPLLGGRQLTRVSRRRKPHDEGAATRAEQKRRRKGQKFARDMARTAAGKRAAYDAIVLRSRTQQEYVRWLRSTPVEG